MSERPAVGAALERAVLVEAGHRCAIPVCRATTTEIAHIVPWSKVREHTFDNLIALCPTCHTRFDKGEIDHKAMQIYKNNLSILNHRYGEFERRIFVVMAEAKDNKDKIFVLGLGGDILVANAVKDGLFVDFGITRGSFDIATLQPDGTRKVLKSFPNNHTYIVTEKGWDFIHRYVAGINIG